MHSTDTENKILASAEKLFYQKGKAGASMQDIADDAGINRTLLNYYYRTKDQLFEAVFRQAMGRFVPNMAKLFRTGMAMDEFMPELIHTVIDSMLTYPQIPTFVLQELSSNPERMPQVMKELGMEPGLLFEKMAGGVGAQPGIDPRQLVINIISLCVFPFAARPVISEILYGGDQEAYLQAMEERKALVPELFKLFTTQNPES